MDNTDIQDMAGYYLNMFEQIRKKVTDVQLATVIMQEIAKDRRQRHIEERRQPNGDGPASESQLAYLRKLGVSIPANITKREASRLIDEALGNGGRSEASGDESREEPEPIRWPRRIP